MIPIRDINPTERFAFVTLLLIVANLAVFFYELRLGSAAEVFVSTFALVPGKLFSAAGIGGPIPAWLTVFTSMFLHGGIAHLAGNMLYLWIFGNNIEDSMGRFRFVVFYLLCGTAAAYVHALANAQSMVPMIGASGAVSGILGAYLLLFPRARVRTVIFFGFYIRFLEIPAMFVLGFWFILQFLSALVSTGSGQGIAWYAHIGGFIAGILLIGLFKRSDVPFAGRKRDDYL